MKAEMTEPTTSVESREATFHAHPVTADMWPDLEKLFGTRGACGGCWCMYWVLRQSTYTEQKGEGNKVALHARIISGEEPGILGYLGDKPVAWCAIQPRERYNVLERSKILAPVDNELVWSIVCLFVAKEHRHKGLTVEMIKYAVTHARDRGARIVEAYPVEPKGPGEVPPAFAWTGLASAFRQAGFTEVARRSETRPVMRLST
ncbi:MAG: GNAT family N-acetyltransferase [Chloroflexia bacterium]